MYIMKENIFNYFIKKYVDYINKILYDCHSKTNGRCKNDNKGC